MRLTVATLNLRTAGAPDGWNAWWLRRGAVARALGALDADVVGLQEVHATQRTWLEHHMSEEYEVISRGRVAPDRGERSAVLVRRGVLAVEEVDARWYSETPERPGSKAWGARFPRFGLLVTVRGDDGPFLVACTHFDHTSDASRERAGALLADWVASSIDPGRAIVLGDTNCVTDATALRPLFDVGMADALAGVPARGPGARTVHSFRGGRDGPRIDQVLVGDRWEVRDARIVAERQPSWSGRRWPSDHHPVVATLEGR